MASMTPSADRPTLREDLLVPEAYASGISWAAVIAGAFVTAALWLILLALGVGIDCLRSPRGRTWELRQQASERRRSFG